MKFAKFLFGIAFVTAISLGAQIQIPTNFSGGVALFTGSSPGSAYAHCSGSVIKTGYVLTAGHCALVGQKVYVQINKQLRPAELVKNGMKDPVGPKHFVESSDWAVLKVDTTGMEPLLVQEREPIVERVGMMISSRRAFQHAVPFFFTGVVEEGLDTWVLVGTVIPGDSGSPVLDEDQFIVGVMVGRDVQDGRDVGLMCPATAFAEFVKGLP